VVEIRSTGELTKSVELFNVEPFQYYVNPLDFWVEILFYAMIGWFLLQEILEIWDCTGWAPPLETRVPIRRILRSGYTFTFENLYRRSNSGP
jgi:hypothetical protein